MSSCKAYASSQATALQPMEADRAERVPAVHPIEPFVTAITSAQLAYFNFVGQATLAWFDITVGRFMTQAARATAGQSKAGTKAATAIGTAKRSHFAEINGADWLCRARHHMRAPKGSTQPTQANRPTRPCSAARSRGSFSVATVALGQLG